MGRFIYFQNSKEQFKRGEGMTKKKVLFWRITLILIIILGGSFYIKKNLENKENINSNEVNNSIPILKEDQVIKVKNKVIQHNGEIKLNIRPEDFYKK